MWGKVFIHLGEAGQVYICAAQLEHCPEDLIPEVNVAAGNQRREGESNMEFTRRIVQETINELTEAHRGSRVLVLPDGPYAICVVDNGGDDDG